MATVSAFPEIAALPVESGIGLRAAHRGEFSRRRPDVGWIEVHTENFLGGGPTSDMLFELRRDYSISLHGVGLSLGSADGLDERHLNRVAELARRLQPAEISDHVSWSVSDGVYFNDLIPIPYDEESLAVIAANVQRFQDALGRRVLVENPATYLSFSSSQLSETAFLAELCRRTGCALLLDVNNIFVSASNQGYDARSYLEDIAGVSVGEMHLSGHFLRRIGNRAIRIDNHASPVSDDVWSLYRHALAVVGPRPTLIEWDSDLPELDRLLAEAKIAGRILADARTGK
jgi:uncharacterized protein (UPF0276 family)